MKNWKTRFNHHTIWGLPCGRQLPSAQKPNVTTTIWSFLRPSMRKAKMPLLMRRLEWVNFWPQKTKKEVLHYIKYLMGRVFMFMLLPQIIIQPIPTHHLKFNFGSYLFIKLHWRLWWLYCLVFRKLMACLTCFQSHSNIWFKKDPSHNTLVPCSDTFSST